jgi:glycosyltransferase involved in cell wall biosynthesis
VNVVQINYAFDEALRHPDALLQRYATLTGWSNALAGAGARVTVLQQFRTHASVTRDGIEYVFCPSPNRRLASLRAPADIAHVNGLIFPWKTRSLRRLLPGDAAIVVQDHGGEPAAGTRAPASILRRVAQRANLRVPDAFLFSAAGQADAWRRAGLMTASQPVYHVMEASTGFRPMARAAARRMTGIDGAPALLWVGRLNANKDPLTVLSGFERSLSDRPHATLTMIYSADDLLPSVRERVAASSGLRARVRLVGRVAHDQMPAYYSAADLFVIGSHHEGSGYALIEACACGAVPVVPTIPTFRAITADGSVGALWTPGDAASFAHALVAIGRRDLASCRGALVEHIDRTLSWPVVGRRALEI